MKFIKVRATGHRNNDKNDTFDAEFLLNKDLIKLITFDGRIILKEDGGLDTDRNSLIDTDSYFTDIALHDSIADDFLNKYI